MASARSAHSALLDTLRRLAETDGPPGREGGVRRSVLAEVKSDSLRAQVSPLGSLYLERRSTKGARVMLAAHLDEVGLIVSHVDRYGIAWLHPAGKLQAAECSGAGLRFAHGALAVLGCAATSSPAEQPPRLLADFGARLPAPSVRTGSMGVFATSWQVERGLVRGKALDSRVGVALALHAARRTRKAAHSLVLALTTLGQVGQRAARAAADELAPDWILTLGVLMLSGRREPEATLAHSGRGPAIVVRAPRFVADARLTETLVETAARARLPHQVVVTAVNPTGAEEMQAALGGIPTATILVPATGVGTPLQSVDARDVEAALELIVRVVERPPAR
jgi:endoglucanase